MQSSDFLESEATPVLGAGAGRRYWAGGGDTAVMGYDPYRKHRTTRVDYVLVAAATIVAAGLVVWALVG